MMAGAVDRSLTAARGPTLPTWALQQVVGYLRYTGRDANAVAKAALDPNRPFAQVLSCTRQSRNFVALFDHFIALAVVCSATVVAQR